MQRFWTLFSWLTVALITVVAPAHGEEAAGEKAPVAETPADARRGWLEKIETDRRNHRAFLATKRDFSKPPEDFYLTDSTLQPDDVIVTESGFLVFAGSADNYPHRETDFKRLNKAEGERRFRVRPSRQKE
jgi:hypothetical protein